MNPRESRTAIPVSNFKINIMRKLLWAIMAIVFNSLLFSCSTDPIAATDSLYDVRATEGDDHDPPIPPPEDIPDA